MVNVLQTFNSISSEKRGQNIYSMNTEFVVEFIVVSGFLFYGKYNWAFGIERRGYN